MPVHLGRGPPAARNCFPSLIRGIIAIMAIITGLHNKNVIQSRDTL